MRDRTGNGSGVRTAERGSALILATVFLFVVSALVVALLVSAGSEFRNSSRALQNLSAMMLSEAGSHRMLGQLNTVGGFPTSQLMAFQVQNGSEIYTAYIPYPRDQYADNHILRFGDNAPDAQLSGTSVAAGRYWATFYPLYTTADLPPQPWDMNGPPLDLYGIVRASGVIQGELRGVEMYVHLNIQPPDVPNPFDMALFGDQSVTLNGNSFTDSYNSQLGSYAAQAVNPADPGDPNARPVANANGDVGSNGTITLDGNSWAYGDAAPGPGMPPAATGPNAGITGNNVPAADPTVLDPVEMPFPAQPMGPVLPALVLNGNDTVNLPTGTYVFPSATVNGNPASQGLIIPAGADVTIYVQGDFAMGGHGKFTIGDGATVTLIVAGTTTTAGTTALNNQGDLTWYGQGAMTFQGNATTGAAVNLDAGIDIFTYSSLQAAGSAFVNDTGTPHNMAIWSLGDAAVDPSHAIQFMGNANYVGTVYAPNVPVQFGGSGDNNVYGSVIADSISVVGNGMFHYDESLVNKPLPSADPPQAVFSTVEWREMNETSSRTLTLAPENWPSGYWPESYQGQGLGEEILLPPPDPGAGAPE